MRFIEWPFHLVLVIACLAVASCGNDVDQANKDAQPAQSEVQGAPDADLSQSRPDAETSFAGDIDLGQQLFSDCAACHSIVDPTNVKTIRLGGPNLWGVVGRSAGAESGFPYSSSMANSDIVWTPERLDAFLENPQELLPGNSMAYLGMPRIEDRRAMISYLETLD